MNKADDELLSFEHDSDLEEIKGLRWLPWIGKEYIYSEQRMLIVGESHYLTGTEKNRLEAEQPDFTRNVLQTFCVDHKDAQPTFDNLIRCLFGNQKTTPEMRMALWKRLAFYNFVQRPMKTNKKRPKKEDWQSGWTVFAELIQILKPTKCIFIGVAAADNYNPYECLRSKERIGNVAARRFTVMLDKKTSVPCIAIKHTSQYFSWKKWRKILEKEDFLS